ncbi:2-hydroxymuconate semialdehyde hydrolase-like isoform X1 [Salvia splendens]|uniref:2-hydroxymuconate semialdehyde hydrolase-like isoform X1 n=1 Tax=Salvia splendens TaxID=180675 RepID=UPI001C2770DF|nr:2-hydroxymuconate semialdehyde hydrolase-like isoform X1 [Salvia splendens]
MVPFCLSFVSVYGSFLRRCLASAGLSSQSIDIDIDTATTITFWGPSASTKPPLILLHGFGPHGIWQWRPQICFFSRQFSVYVPDLLFFGGSTTESADRSEIFQATSIAKLMEKLGISRYSVVGTSYGGLVAYRMASMWPERVEKVVIASSAANMRRRDHVELMKRAKVEKVDDLLLPSSASQLRKLLGLSVFRRLFMPDFILNDFIDKLYSENREEKLELLKGLTLGQDDTGTICPLSQKVLIVWGEHDKIFLLEKAVELEKYVTLVGENARLEVIHNTSHVPQLEDSGQFNNIVNNFLRDIS